MDEFDSPWKETLDLLFEHFLAFFFPDIHSQIDWSRGYEILDGELERIVREAEMGKRLADKLFKVWRLDGTEAWVLIHVEVQSQPDREFEQRMFVYHYRIFDHYKCPVASLALLADERENWRPSEFLAELWGSEVRFRFRTAKLLEWRERTAELEEMANPLGLIVLAHLQSQATRANMDDRREWKFRLIRHLLDREYPPERVRQIMRVIDWLLVLPVELEERLTSDVQTYEETRRMKYVTSWERIGMERGQKEGERIGLLVGLHEGLDLALELKFGDAGKAFMAELRNVNDVSALRVVHQAIRGANSIDELRVCLEAALAK